MIQKIKTFVIAHKLLTTIIVLVVGIGSYYIFKGSTPIEVRYVTTTVQKGTVVSLISGTGQVEASSTVNLQSKISGTITSVAVKSGATVHKGQMLFAVDSANAGKAVRNAKLNLQSAQNDLKNAQSDYENTKTSQALSLTSSYLTLNSDAVAVADDSNSNTSIVTLSGSYNSLAQGRYTLEVYACQGVVCVRYSGLEHGDFPIDINVPKALGTRGLYATFTSLPKAGEKWYVDVPSPTTGSYLSNSRSYAEKEQSAKEAVDAAQKTITSRELSLQQSKNALIDAEDALSDYYVFAPFDGTIASVTGKLGDIASSTLGTIITKQKIASVTLNEVDVSKVHLGQKATLTFDAVDGLSITGEVVEIDGVGTVTQGVVSYTVKINFDTDDIRVKPGMSVSASIITATAQDVLVVPASAIKTNTNSSYVETFAIPLPVATGTTGVTSLVLPQHVTVETGISDDTSTEIKSGLKEGDQVVSRTITTTTKTATASTPSLFGSTGARTGNNAVRNATR